MIIALLAATGQVAVALLIAWILFAVTARKRLTFGGFVGLTLAPARAAFIGATVGVCLSLAVLAIPGSANVLIAAGTVTGDALLNFSGTELVVVLLVTAMFTTAFSEEVIFRGLLGKGLIRWLGFRLGNLIQALLFGLVHLVLLLVSTVTPAVVVLTVLTTASLGWFNGWLNERVGRGSILPGWSAHAAANVATYFGVLFMRS